MHKSKPLVKVGDKIKKGDIIADGPATKLENWLWVKMLP